MQRRLLRCLAVVRAIFRVSTKSQARESGTGQFEHYERESPLACPKGASSQRRINGGGQPRDPALRRDEMLALPSKD